MGIQAHKDAVAAALEKGKSMRIRAPKPRANSAANNQQQPVQQPAHDPFASMIGMAQAMKVMKECFASPTPPPPSHYYSAQAAPLNMPQGMQGFTPPNFSAAAPPAPPSSQVIPYGQQTMVYGPGAQNGVFFNTPAQ